MHKAQHRIKPDWSHHFEAVMTVVIIASAGFVMIYLACLYAGKYGL